MNYTEAQEVFSTARDYYKGKPIGNNTRLYKRGNSYAVRLHSTDVVTIHPDDTYTLNSGGWETVTTKQRINQYSPASVYSDRGTWLVGGCLFEVGMKVGSGGASLNWLDPLEDTTLHYKLKDLVRNYINGFTEAIKAGTLDNPSLGDCWLCCSKKEFSAAALEDHHKYIERDVNHILHHFVESYYVPSLLANALQEHDRSDCLMSTLWFYGTHRDHTNLARTALRRYFRVRKPLLLKELKQILSEDRNFLDRR